MTATMGEVALEVLMLMFVGCGIVGVVGCASALLKKCYDKYVLKLEPTCQTIAIELQQSIALQNTEEAYETPVVDVCLFAGEDPIDVIAVEVV
jgi:hypothetical protein